MIFKIEMDYTNLGDVIELFKDKYDILFCKHLYISEIKKTKTNNCKKIKEKMKDFPNSFITSIDEYNLSNQPLQAQEWCRDKFVEQDLKNFEEKEQDKLIEMMDIIHNFDNALNNILKNKQK
jgi:hypothetical protein